MKIFIFGGTREQSESYKNNNSLFQAVLIKDSRALIGVGTCEVHLVGTYQCNPEWEAVREEIGSLRNFGMVTVHVEEVR